MTVLERNELVGLKPFATMLERGWPSYSGVQLPCPEPKPCIVYRILPMYTTRWRGGRVRIAADTPQTWE